MHNLPPACGYYLRILSNGMEMNIMKDNQWIRKIGVAAAVLIAIVLAAYVMTRCANADGAGATGTQSEAGPSGQIAPPGGEGPPRLAP